MPTAAQLEHFKNHPEQFMQANEVRFVGAGPVNATVILVSLRDVAGHARIRTGSRFLGLGNAKASVPKFELRWMNSPHNPQPDDPSAFEVQWSGYSAKEAHGILLPANEGPNLMLTPELTGCAVACRDNGNGTANFIHYNLRQPARPTETLARAEMEAAAQAELGHNVHTLTKEEYRAIGRHSQSVTVTVVGIRKNAVWKFFAQFREFKASGQQIRLVRQL